MKKIVIAFLCILSSGLILADDLKMAQGVTATPAAKTIIVYDPIKHTETASNIFMLWGGTSAVVGVITAPFALKSYNNYGVGNNVSRGLGVGSLIYGAVETTMAICYLNWADKITDPDKARAAMIDKSGLHSVLGLAQLAAGSLVAIFGSNDLKGYGLAMAIQGSFFSIYDSMNYFIAKDPGTVRDWQTNNDIEVRARLVSIDFYAK
jgi:hypothetical protein